VLWSVEGWRPIADCGEQRGLDVFFPPMILCTDNAAMIAVVGEHLLKKGQRGSLDLNAVSRWPLDKMSG
jgi:N6-L-threonylcarbamoyladenine synthase